MTSEWILNYASFNVDALKTKKSTQYIQID